MSDGKFVTLGYKEVHDLECIVKKIKSLEYINKLVILFNYLELVFGVDQWGQLLYCNIHQFIKVLQQSHAILRMPI